MKDLHMKPDAGVDLTLPAALAAEIQAAADEEHRPVLDVLRDAVEIYRREQRWRRTLAYGGDRVRKLGVTEADVPDLITAYRLEKRRPLASE